MDNKEPTIEELMEEIRKDSQESERKPKFRMDENGNIERIDSDG